MLVPRDGEEGREPADSMAVGEAPAELGGVCSESARPAFGL